MAAVPQGPSSLCDSGFRRPAGVCGALQLTCQSNQVRTSDFIAVFMLFFVISRMCHHLSPTWLHTGSPLTKGSVGIRITSPATPFTSAVWTVSRAPAPWTSACGATGMTSVNGLWSRLTSGSCSPEIVSTRENMFGLCSNKCAFTSHHVHVCLCRQWRGLCTVAGTLCKPQQI